MQEIMKMNIRRKKRFLVGMLFLMTSFFWPQGSSFAVRYDGKADDGTLHFICETSCGRVRVKKIDSKLFRVFSIGYSGDLIADSEKQAARKACGELDISGSKRVSPKSTRGNSGC